MAQRDLKVTLVGSDDSGSAFKSMGDSAGKLVGVLAGAGLAAGAALGAGLLGAMNVEAANDKLAAQLGATGAYAEDLGKIAGNLYAGAYGDSLGQVNEALRTVMQSGLVFEDASNDAIQGVTATVMDLATAFDQDLAAVTRGAGALMKNGLAPDAQTAFDIVTRGFQQGVDKSEDYLDTLNEYSPLFSRLGLDGTKATGLLSQGLKAGARDADTVADALKEFQIRATDGSKTSAEGFALLGLNAGKFTKQIAKGGPEASAGLATVLDKLRAMKDPVAQNAAAVALFGTKAEDLGASLFALDPTSAVAALGDVTGAAAKMGATLNDNAATNLESFKRQVMSAFVEFVGGKALPVISQFASALAVGFGPAVASASAVFRDDLLPVLRTVGGFIGDNILPIIAALGAAWAAAGIAAAITAISAAFLAAGAAILSAGGVMSAALAAIGGPITLVIIGIAALAAGLVYAYKHSEQFRAVVAKVAAFLTGTVVPAIMVLVDALRAKMAEAVAYVVEVWPQISKTIKSVMDIAANVVKVALGVIQGAWNLFGATLVSFVAATFGNIAQVIRGVLEVIKGIVNVFVGVLTGDWSRAWDGIKSIVGGALNIVKALIGQALDVIKAVVSGAWAAVQAATGAAWNAIRSVVAGAVGAVVGAISGLGQIPGQVAGFFNSAKDSAGGALNGLVSLVAGIPGRVVGALGNLGGLLLNAGRDLMMGLARGISERIEVVVGKVRDAVALIGRLLPGSPIKDGPLKSWNNGGAGLRLMDMLAGGIVSGQGGVRSALTDALDVGGMNVGGTGFINSRLGISPSSAAPTTSTRNLTVNISGQVGEIDESRLMVLLQRAERLAGI